MVKSPNNASFTKALPGLCRRLVPYQQQLALLENRRQAQRSALSS